jgi:hypothetical protein
MSVKRPLGVGPRGGSNQASLELAAEDLDLGDDRLLPGQADAVGIAGLSW